MPSQPLPQLLQAMRECAECRTLAVDYGQTLTAIRWPGANPRDHGVRLTVTRIDLFDHLISAHSDWLADRRPDCDLCETWREQCAVGPIEHAEAEHRVEHLCEPLRDICVPSRNKLAYLM